MRFKTLLAFVLALGVAVPSAASGTAVIAMQSGATFDLEPGQAYQVQFLHTGEKTPDFHAWLDGQILKNYAAADLTRETVPNADCGAAAPSCVRITTSAMPAFTAAQVGSHTFGITASVKNVDGKTLHSEPTNVTIRVGFTSAPPPPAGVVILKIAIQADGTLKILGIERADPGTVK